MRKKTKNETIDEAAARWAARLDHGALSHADSLALEDWTNADSRHQGALARAQAMLVACDDTEASLPLEGGARWKVGRALTWAGGLTGAAAAVAFSVLVISQNPGSDPAYQTVYGEVRRVPLNDGSVMTLNTLSQADIDFRESQRNVRLIAGEGYFEVAPDAARPFVVEADGYTVRAVGTAFVVRNSSPGAELQVLVHEGTVDIGRKNGEPIRLTAGEMAKVNLREQAPTISNLDEEQLLQELAWRQGKIALTGQSLDYAAREFNRYNAISIRVDPSVADLEVVGWYSANDPAGFARLVAQTMDIDVDINNDRILLRPLSCDDDCAKPMLSLAEPDN